MKPLVLFIFFQIGFIQCSFGQLNIVYDSSFNQHSTYWHPIKTVDYYSSPLYSFEGDVEGHTGQAFVGLRLFHTTNNPADQNWQEYVYQNLFIDQLQAGVTYKVSFFYTLGDAVLHTTDDFGIAFFEDSLLFIDTETKFRSKTAQVRNEEGNYITNYKEWKEFVGFYTATGNETHVGLGAFKVDSTLSQVPISTDYYIHYDELMVFFDDISIRECIGAPISTMGDVFLCNPTSVTLNAYNADATYKWSTGDTTSSIVVGQEEGVYWVKITGNGCVVTDSVRVNIFDTPENLEDKFVCGNSELPVVANISWEPGETILWSTGETSPTCTLQNSGKYWVRKTQDDCLWTDTMTIVNFEEDVYLYPNPTSETFFISNDLDVMIKRVTASNGQIVWEGLVQSSEFDKIIIGLVSGLYFINYEGYGCEKVMKCEVLPH